MLPHKSNGSGGNPYDDQQSPILPVGRFRPLDLGVEREESRSTTGLKDQGVVREVGGQPTVEPPQSTGYGSGRISGPVAMLKSMAEKWHLQPDQLAILLGYETYEADAVTKLLTGATTLRGRDQKDRATYLLAIYGLLQSVFHDSAVGHDWLTENKQALGGESPLGRMLKGSMEDLLSVKRLVQVLAGH